MSTVVQKYGGSSVATPDRLRAVAERVVRTFRAGNNVVVVVSAMGRTTDALVALAQEVSGESHRREMDMILTAGERVSMALLAMAIRDLGCEAISLTGSQAGIITTSDHNQARIIEVRPVRVIEGLDAGQIVIVGGFAGVSVEKEVTTLGRGGSDTTAIAIAAALEAETCDIFSDVDGVYTADPRIVEDARRIDELSHSEILEMGLRGARVLAPEAIDHARRFGVTLRARAAFKEGRGTVMTAAPRPGVGRATAVCSDGQCLPVEFEGTEAAVQELLDHLREAGVDWRGLELTHHDTEDAVAGRALLDRRNTAALDEILARAADALTRVGGSLVQRTEDASVTVVGAGIAERAECWRLARETLAEIGVRASHLTGSAWGITALVERSRVDDVVRAWHGAFPGLGAPEATSDLR